MTWQEKSWVLALEDGMFVISKFCGAPYLFGSKRIARQNVSSAEERPVRVLVTVTDEITPKPRPNPKLKRKRKGA